MRTDNIRIFSIACALLGLAVASAAEAGPKIETWETTKGARVLFVAAPDLPMLDVRLVFDAGSARDDKRSGLASLTANMLTQGAGEWDADTIAERIESVGAEFSASAARDMATLSLRTLTAESALDQALETVAKSLSKPRFDQADFERVRENRLVALRQDEQDPSTLGSKAIYRKVFGDHPYAADSAGTLETVSAIRREELVEFHRRYYVAGNAVVAIVGALAQEQARDLAERLTADLDTGEPPPELPPVPELSDPVLERLSFPSTQTHVFAGQPGMRRLDPDYFPLYVGNHILGGSGLVSLLMDEVREKRGLSYSVYSYFYPMSQRGPFLMGLQTKNDQADQARAVLMDTVRRFREQGPTEAELTAAIKHITGGFPRRIASNSKVVGYLAVIGFYGLPLDYLDRFSERVSKIRAEQIRDAFHRRVHPDRFATVIVGPREDRAADGED
ncbi:M16 family metallopeptidase [Candidatus Thiosymbion oneisti]|uniref:M16 family metallopeptidase n=1 Tax=Candidatus Thiosymbion oneisti TaxID=589554 RepID=UPI000A9FA2B4|nr:pitrilysin family protein [Candidatus Thiosymbion oneisti]